MNIKMPSSRLVLAFAACASFFITSDARVPYEVSAFGNVEVEEFVEELEKNVMRIARTLPKLEFRRYVTHTPMSSASRRSVNSNEMMTTSITTWHNVTTTSVVSMNYSTEIIIPVLRVKPKRIVYKPESAYSKVISDDLLPNLRTAARLRDNIVFVFGYILKSPRSNLTVDQRSSLEIIFDAIRMKQVHLYRLLPVMAEINKKNRNVQFEKIMTGLAEIMPIYLRCSAQFWVEEIKKNRFVPKTALAESHEKLGFLAGINQNFIERGAKLNPSDEMEGYNEESKITEAVLGRVFVKMLKNIKDNTLFISPPVFSTILFNLPNPDGDPVFEEYIRFVGELAWNREIPSWHLMKKYRDVEEPFSLIRAMTDRICKNPDVSLKIKEAIIYIRDRFIETENYILHQAIQPTHLLTQGGLNIRLLLSLISPGYFTPSALKLESTLIRYTYSNHEDVQKALTGMNQFGYPSPKELLLAFLSRLRTRLPIEHKQVRKAVTSLLSLMLLKRENWHISIPTAPSGVSLWTLFDAIDDSHVDSETSKLISLILKDLLKNPEVWDRINANFFPDKVHCTSPEICLGRMLKKIVTILPKGSLPVMTIKKIIKLLVIIREETEYSECVQHQDNPLCIGYVENLKNDEKFISDLNSNVKFGDDYPSLPIRINPEERLEITVPDSGSPFIANITSTMNATRSLKTVMLPSVICMQNTAKMDTFGSNCEKVIELSIRQPLITILGDNYTEVLLGKGWNDRYKTRVSFIYDLIDNASRHPKVIADQKFYKVIVRYQRALKYASSYILLPIVVAFLNLDTYVVWSTYHAVYSLGSTISASYPEAVDADAITLPLVHPRLFLGSVNSSDALDVYLPKLPPKDPYAITIEPLISLIRSPIINNYLGKHWNVSDYPNGGALFTALLHKLLESEKIRENINLYQLVESYLKVIELTPIYVKISRDYIRMMVQQYRDRWGIRKFDKFTPVEPVTAVEQFSDLDERISPEESNTLFYPSLNPERNISITLLEFGGIIVKSLDTAEAHSISTNELILPSLVCLEGVPTIDDYNDDCERVFQVTIIEPLIRRFGVDFIKKLLVHDWKSHSPTRIAFLYYLFDQIVYNEKVIDDNAVITVAKAYKFAIEFLAPYIQYPLLTSSNQLDSLVVWLTYSTDNCSNLKIQSRQPDRLLSTSEVILPMINPKTWLLPVDVNKPFWKLIPNLPAHNPYARMIQPLVDLIKTNKILVILGKHWNPAQYSNRGALFLSILNAVWHSEEVNTNKDLHHILQVYLLGMQMTSFCMTIPQEYIEKVVKEYRKTSKTNESVEAIIEPNYEEPISDLDFRIPWDEKAKTYLESIDTDNSIQIVVPYSNDTVTEVSTFMELAPSPYLLLLPSIDCLEGPPKRHEFEDGCEKALKFEVTKPLLHILGDNCISDLLGNDWINHYPTRMSFLLDLLQNSIQHPKLASYPALRVELLRYKIAVEFVASNIFLRIIAEKEKFDTVVVWSTHNYENRSLSKIGVAPPKEVEKHTITFPLINPRTWGNPVDVQNPFWRLVPNLPADNPYSGTLKPLRILLKSGKIRQYLGKDWNPAKYANRGDLFVSILRLLLNNETVRSYVELHTLVKNYLKVLEVPALFTHVPRSYIHEVVYEHHEEYLSDQPDQTMPQPLKKTEDQFSDLNVDVVRDVSITILPPQVNPEDDIHITVPERGLIAESQVVDKNETSPDSVVLPSPICLQSKPSADNSQDNCGHDLEINIMQPLAKIFGKKFIEVILGQDWIERYPTRASFIISLLKNVSNNTLVTRDKELAEKIKTYYKTLKVAAPYLFLPVLTTGNNLNSLVVWLTYSSTNYSASKITSDVPEDKVAQDNTVPLVSPQFWFTSVDLKNPFFKLLPHLPDDNPYAIKLKPLAELFNSGKVREYLEVNWNPAQYETRGALFVSVLQTLSKSEKIKSQPELRQLVKSYLNNIEMASVSIKLPDTYVEKVVEEYRNMPKTDDYNMTIVHTVSHKDGITDLDMKIDKNEKPPLVLQSINPANSIHVVLPTLNKTVVEYTTSSMNITSEHIVTVPSVFCLESPPRAYDNEDDCEKVFQSDIMQPLIKIYGENYIETILGKDWIKRYPTRMSFLLDLFKKVEENPKVRVNKQYTVVIKNYEIALKAVATDIFVPMIADSEHFDTMVVWSSYNPKNPSESRFETAPPEKNDGNTITLPIVNPKIWGMPVDVQKPFWKLVPNLPENNPYAVKLKPLTVLFKTGKVRELLGEDWNPSQYPNRGTLFVSILHKLLEVESVRSNIELYALVQNYLKTIEVSSLYSHVSRTNIKKVVEEYHNISVTTEPVSTTTESPIEIQEPLSDLNMNIVNITLLPPPVNPEKTVEVAIESGELAIESFVSEHNVTSSNAVVIPPVSCLERRPSANGSNEECGEDLQSNIIEPVVHIFGKNFADDILGKDWKSRYPTTASFLDDILHKIANDSRVAKDQQLYKNVKKYTEAIEFGVPYIVLPLICSYKNLDSLVVWVSYSQKNYTETYIGSSQPDEKNVDVVTVPLVNPKFWLAPVDVKNPFFKLLPHLPEDNPYAIKLKPLTELFKTGKIREYLGQNWNASHYENRGVLFMSVLTIISKSDKIKSNVNLEHVVKDYLQTIQATSMSSKLPHSYVEHVAEEYRNVTEILQINKTVTVSRVDVISDISFTIATNRTNNPVLHEQVNPTAGIEVTMSETNEPIIHYSSEITKPSPNSVILPSMICLEKPPRIHDFDDECESILRIKIYEPIIKILGPNCIEEILGDDWVDRHPTRISFLAELLENLQDIEKIKTNKDLHALIKQYYEALDSVAIEVLLPIASDDDKLDSLVVWSIINKQNHSEFKMETGQPNIDDEYRIAMPLVNPQTWSLPVNVKNPLWKLLPNLPEDNPYAIKLKPLTELFKNGKAREMLGKDWNPSQYRNKGLLLVSVLHKLMEHQTVKSNSELYELIHDYVKAIEIPSLYTSISKEHMETVVEQYHNFTLMNEPVSMTTQQSSIVSIETFSDLGITIAIDENAPMFPSVMNPKESIHLIVPDSDLPVAHFLASERNVSSHELVIMPSVACLENSPLADVSDHDCLSYVQPNINQPLSTALGYHFIEVLLGSDWRSQYPTKMAVINQILKSALTSPEVNENMQLILLIQKYNEALKYIVPYIFLPLLTAYNKIETLVVWITFYSRGLQKPYIGSQPPEHEDYFAITMPILNPRLWMNPVDLKHPFAKLLPYLPEDNPYAIKLKPLTSLFKSPEIYNYLGPDWNPSKYVNRGDLLISVLRTLINSEAARSNRDMYTVVKDYCLALEVTAMYAKIPDSYVNEIIEASMPAKPVTEVKTLSDLDIRLVIEENSLPIPPFINPERRIIITVSDKLQKVMGYPTSSESMITSNAVILPSLLYLMEMPNFDNSEVDCDKTLQVRLLKPLSKIFGEGYVEALLGEDWSIRYRTRLSVLHGMLRIAEEHPDVAANRFLLKMVKQYMVALKFVAPYIFLPIISNHKKLDSMVVWATYYSTSPLQSELKSNPDNPKFSGAITLPLLNPVTWSYPVDRNNPFSKLLPNLPPKNSYAKTIQPLTDLLKSGNITNFFEKDWNYLQYPNKGALFLTILNKLSTSQQILSDAKLHQLVKCYIEVIEWSSIYFYLPSNLPERVITDFNKNWAMDDTSRHQNKSSFQTLNDIINDPNAGVLSPIFNPNENIKVSFAADPPNIESSAGIIISCSSTRVILPSLICLEDPPTIENSGDLCDKVLELCITEPLISIFGDNYIEEILNPGWKVRYVTRISFLTDLLKSAAAYPEVEMNHEIAENIKSHTSALELVGSYILLPIVASYRKLTSHVVWSTISSTDHSLSTISDTPPWGVTPDLTTLPLFNPKTWFLPVDVQDPYANLIPDFPSSNPFTTALYPLVSLLNMDSMVQLLGPSWNADDCQNRGSFFLYSLDTLLLNEKVQSDYQLYRLIENYRQAIIYPSLYNRVPSSYIKSISHRSAGFWSINLVDLLMALPSPKTPEEGHYWQVLRSWLGLSNLLQKLGIPTRPMITKRSQLLTQIIFKALSSSSKIELDTEVESALKYYKDKVQTKGFGAKLIVWVWSRGWVEKTTVNLGSIFTSTVDLKALSLEEQEHYQNLIKYLHDNPDFLAIQEFPIDEYRTTGEFLKGYLKYLENAKGLDPQYKKSIEIIIPHVLLDGPGEVPMPQPVREDLP